MLIKAYHNQICGRQIMKALTSNVSVHIIHKNPHKKVTQQATFIAKVWLNIN